MHELPIIQSVYKTVLARAQEAGAISVTRVVLEIGILRDYVPEIVQKYWDYIAPGSIAEGAKIEIRELDAVARCGRCSNEYTITKGHIAEAHCPVCGYERGQLLSGDSLRIVGIEIKKKLADGTV